MDESLHSLLLSLAQRNDETCTDWIGPVFSSNLSDQFFYCYCYICEKTFPNSNNAIEKHGMQHLKEKNLLPFI